MSHYFIENRKVLTNERLLNAEIFGMKFKFLSNNGLFSCDKVDDVSGVLIENLPVLKGSLLDLGCGYGFIGIVLAKKYKLDLTMSDINSIAVNYAETNAKLNAIEAKTICSNGFENIHGSFDTITLNPPIHAGKDIIYKLYKEAALHLSKGGNFYVVIQKKHGAESSYKKLCEIFDSCDVVYKKKGCFIFRATLQHGILKTNTSS